MLAIATKLTKKTEINEVMCTILLRIENSISTIYVGLFWVEQ